jgi:hypothetical protein
LHFPGTLRILRASSIESALHRHRGDTT